MARSRNIKPSFFTNDKLAECQPLARILFAGLWTLADREGRLHNRPKKIKAEILPYDECDCVSLLKELTGNQFIICYSADGEDFIQIVNFNKHQNPHVKEAESTIPAPGKPRKIRNKPGLNPLTDSPILIPESITPSPGFEDWYELYPHKIGKGAAENSYVKARKLASSDELLEGVRKYIRSKPPDRAWCNPATWLNQQRWKDEPNEITEQSSRKSKSQELDDIVGEYLAEQGITASRGEGAALDGAETVLRSVQHLRERPVSSEEHAADVRRIAGPVSN